jgi:hypothetical protein
LCFGGFKTGTGSERILFDPKEIPISLPKSLPKLQKHAVGNKTKTFSKHPATALLHKKKGFKKRFFSRGHQAIKIAGISSAVQQS